MHDVFKLSNQILLACALSLAALLVLTLQFHRNLASRFPLPALKRNAKIARFGNRFRPPGP